MVVKKNQRLDVIAVTIGPTILDHQLMWSLLFCHSFAKPFLSIKKIQDFPSNTRMSHLQSPSTMWNISKMVLPSAVDLTNSPPGKGLIAPCTADVSFATSSGKGTASSKRRCRPKRRPGAKEKPLMRLQKSGFLRRLLVGGFNPSEKY